MVPTGNTELPHMVVWAVCCITPRHFIYLSFWTALGSGMFSGQGGIS